MTLIPNGQRVAIAPFPVVPHASGRYLVSTPYASPFPILCRVCWIIFPLAPADARAVLDDTVAKGFNAIEMKAPIRPSPGNSTGQDSAGHLPFAKRLDGATWTGSTTYVNINNEAPDFSTPIEAYWLSLDQFFTDCAVRGLLCFYFPAYVGYPNTDWWMHEVEANGATKMQTYGAFVATRYKNQKNLVWMLGGDDGTAPNTFSTSEAAALTGLHTGLTSVATASAQYGAEWTYGSIAKDLFPSTITLNSVYATVPGFGDVEDGVCNQGGRGYSYTPATPAYFQELPFEDNVSTPPPIRQYHWWGWLTTIGGYSFGQGTFTSFDPTTYAAKMNTPATLDAQRINQFVRSIASLWYTLVPNNAAVTAGAGTTDTADQVVAAVNPAGSLLLAYVPTSHTGTITINMALMGGVTLARWFDPTNGTYTAIGSGLSNSGTHAFTLPGNDSAGDADWLLRLDA